MSATPVDVPRLDETLALSAKQRDWIDRHMPCVGKLVGVEQAIRAYELRRAHCSYKQLKAVFACGRTSIQRAIRLVATALGDDPREWQAVRRNRRQAAKAERLAHRRQGVEKVAQAEREVAILRRAQFGTTQMRLAGSGRDAFAEQARLDARPERTPSQPSFSPHLTPARRPVNPFERR